MYMWFLLHFLTCCSLLLFIVDESSIGMLYSALDQRNVGKSLTMDILAKAQGVPNRSHPSMLAGGDQSQSGASVYVWLFTIFKLLVVY